MSTNKIAEISRHLESKMVGYGGPWAGYSDKPGEMPLAGYATLLAAYGIVFGPAFVRHWRRRNAPTPGPSDVVLFGIATHKIGRIITKDWVTSPIRAPFTKYVESSGAGEVKEQSRGTGLRRAMGDLLTCPWCIAPWVSGAIYSTFLLKPRAARLAAACFTSVALSDFLQHGYAVVHRASKG